MSNLILSFISIALIAATAAATVFFGGDAVRSGSNAAHAATLQNIASQVSGYTDMYWAVEGSDPDSVFEADTPTGNSLEEAGFLKSGSISIPHEGGTISLTSDGVEIDAVPTEVCDAVNNNAGVDSRPADAANVVTTYACYGATDSEGTVLFK